MGLLPDTWNCGLRMRRECRERFFPSRNFKGNRYLAIPECITARASRTCRDACRDRLPAVAGKTFPAFPAHAQPAIVRIWQEAHALRRQTPIYSWIISRTADLQRTTRSVCMLFVYFNYIIPFVQAGDARRLFMEIAFKYFFMKSICKMIQQNYCFGLFCFVMICRFLLLTHSWLIYNEGMHLLRLVLLCY